VPAARGAGVRSCHPPRVSSRPTSANDHVNVGAGGHEKSPPQAVSQGFADGPPALVLASFIR